MEKKTLEAAAVMTLPASGHTEKVSLRWAVLPLQRMLRLLCQARSTLSSVLRPGEVLLPPSSFHK